MPTDLEQEVEAITAVLEQAGVKEVFARVGQKSVDWHVKNKFRAGYRHASTKAEVRKRLAPFNLDYLVQNAGRISHV